MKPNVIFTATIKFKSVQVSATLQQNGINTLVDRWLQADTCTLLNFIVVRKSHQLAQNRKSFE